MSGPGALCTEVLGRFRGALDPAAAVAVSRRLGELLEAFRASCSSSLSALNQAAARIRAQASAPLFPDGAAASLLERLGALDESLRGKCAAQQALDGAGVRRARQAWSAMARESAQARESSAAAWKASFSTRKDAAAREHATALDLYRSVLAAYQRATGAAPEGRSGIPSLLDEGEARGTQGERAGREAGRTAGRASALGGDGPRPDLLASLLPGVAGISDGDGGADAASGAGGQPGAGGPVAGGAGRPVGSGAHGLDALLLDF